MQGDRLKNVNEKLKRNFTFQSLNEDYRNIYFNSNREEILIKLTLEMVF